MREVIDWICDLLGSNGFSPKVGAIPVGGNLAIQQSSGSVQGYSVRTGAIRETYVINAKGPQQETLELLEAVHAVLTKRREYGSTSSFQIATIRTLNEPAYLGQTDGEEYLYGSSIEVLVYDRRKSED